jgi:hypothetical protein
VQSDNKLLTPGQSSSSAENTVNPQVENQVPIVDEEGTAWWLARTVWGMFIHIL